MDLSTLPWSSPRRACAPSPAACASSPKTSPTPIPPPRTPGGDPYRRKVATMQSDFDRDARRHAGRSRESRSHDMSDFRTQYDPGNPAADKQGYVKLPNVNPLSKSWTCARRSAPTKPISP